MTTAATVPEWATTSGDVWARRWRDTDRALESVSPHLLSAIRACAPQGPFRAFEVGCGPGSTTIDVADAFPQAMITACDISPALAAIARERSADTRAIRVLVGDAEALATEEGPFELIFSRHGVMFFPDPVQAFRSVRRAASPDASLVFSCFQAWESNPWASKLACAAAGKTVPSPGREPSGFAFADPDYASQILMSSGWADAASEAISFDYVAGAGEKAVESALSFHSDLGPAARILQALPDEEKGSAVARMRGVIEQHFDGAAVTFPAAAWIWRAKAS